MIKKTVFSFILSGLFVAIPESYAQLSDGLISDFTADVRSGSDPAGIDFIENRGQWTQPFRYKAELPGGLMFLTDQGIVYNYLNEHDVQLQSNAQCTRDDSKKAGTWFLPVRTPEKPDNKTIRGHAYKVNFEGARSSADYQTENRRPYYHNYFLGNDSNLWQGRIGLFGAVQRNGIYEGIDLKLYSNQHGALKYDFIVAPGADPDQIVLSFEGVIPELTAGGDLFLRTSVNEVTELAPYSYQVINGKKVEVKSSYVLKGGRLTYSFPEGFDKAHELIIDPTLVFASFSGGRVNFFYAHSTTYDKRGNTYVSALMQGYLGWPVTLGAYQQQASAAAYHTTVISKFNTSGSDLLFATYYGTALGTYGAAQPNSLRVNEKDELVMAGAVNTATLPVTPGAYQNALRGPSDIHIARFSEDGSQLIASTYIGGSQLEASQINNTNRYDGLGNPENAINPVDIAFDDQGNIWMTSNTSSYDFPVSTNAFQRLFSGVHDVVICKFSPDLSTLLYSTYMGTAGWDGGICIEYNSNTNTIGTAGFTGGAGFPVTPGAYTSSAPGGGSDGYALLIDNSTYQVEASTYLGTAAPDVATRLSFDCANNVYVAGITIGGNYPVTSASGAVPNGYIFIDKLRPDLSGSMASTRTGAPVASIVPSSMLVDHCGNVLIATLTFQEIQPGMPLTPDAFIRDPRGFYFAGFKGDLSSLIFGSYFGNAQGTTADDHYHPGISRIDPEGIVYHSVCAAGPLAATWPVTPGCFSPTKQNGTSNDNIAFKFSFDIPYASASTTSGGGAGVPETHCVRGCKSAFVNYTRTEKPIPTTVHYKLSGDAINGVDYQWIPDSIVIRAGQSSAHREIKPLLLARETPPNPRHVIITTMAACDCDGDGDYMLSSDTIWIYDSLYVELLSPPVTVCPGTEITIEAEIDSTLDFSWTPANLIPDITGLTIHPLVLTTTGYRITVTQPGAPATCPPRGKTYHAVAEPYPVIQVHDPEIVACPGDSVDVIVSAGPEGFPFIYQWSPPDFLRNDYDPVNKFYGLPGVYRKTIRVTTPVADCAGADSLTITVRPEFQFDRVGPPDTTIHYGDRIQLYATGAAVKHSWSPASYLDNPLSAHPWAAPPEDTRYEVIGWDEYGCPDTGIVRIRVVYHSNTMIPSAFSPNGDGKNDAFRIVNLKYEKVLEFMVFNRYGELVFSETDPKRGWNGWHRGKPAEPGVYFYRILLSLPDGTTSELSGDVTLLR